MNGAHTSAEFVLGSGEPPAGDLLWRAARNAGVRWIDAPHAAAEQSVAAALRGSKGVRVVSTLRDGLRAADPTTWSRQTVIDAVRASCARQTADRLDVLRLDMSQLANAVVWRTVRELRDEGLIYDIGVDVGSADEALAALAQPDVTHIRLTFDAIFWGLRANDVIEALQARPHVAVHVQSDVLQNLLSGAAAEAPLLRATRDLDRDSPADLCLAHIRAQDWIDGVVVNVANLTQLALCLALFQRPPLHAGDCAAVAAALGPAANDARPAREAA